MSAFRTLENVFNIQENADSIPRFSGENADEEQFDYLLEQSGEWNEAVAGGWVDENSVKRVFMNVDGWVDGDEFEFGHTITTAESNDEYATAWGSQFDEMMEESVERAQAWDDFDSLDPSGQQLRVEGEMRDWIEENQTASAFLNPKPKNSSNSFTQEYEVYLRELEERDVFDSDEGIVDIKMDDIVSQNRPNPFIQGYVNYNKYLDAQKDTGIMVDYTLVKTDDKKYDEKVSDAFFYYFLLEEAAQKKVA